MKFWIQCLIGSKYSNVSIILKPLFPGKIHSEFHHGVLRDTILREAGSYKLKSDIGMQGLVERGGLGPLARVLQPLAGRGDGLKRCRLPLTK